MFCNSKIVFLATKPQYFPNVVPELSINTKELPLTIVISIMAGISLKTLKEVRLFKK